MNELIQQTFQGQTITFKSDEGVVFVNATEMAKPFGKLVADWTRLSSTKNYLEELSSVMGNPISQLLTSKKGNTGEYVQGTWMHEDVAMEFARWLSPKFAIWCNQRIKELLSTGRTAIVPEFTIPQTYAEALRLAAEQQEQIEAKNALIAKQTEELEAQEEVIAESQPKLAYYEKAMSADGLYTTTQIAKEFGKSGKEFNKVLHQLGVQYNVNGQWILYAKYANMGLTATKTYLYETDGGTQRRLSTMWTETGRKFLYELMTERMAS